MENQRSSNFCDGKFSWIGFPDDLGVKNVNGRAGAKEGPAKCWEYFQKLKGKNPLLSALSKEVRVAIGPDLSWNHDSATAEAVECLTALDLSKDALIVVGGGHDYAYPWLKAFRENGGKELRLGCLNLDAHFDLRSAQPLMTSGSAFRRAIEEGILEGERLIEFGIQAHCNAPELWHFADQHQITVVPFERCRNGSAVREFESALRKLDSLCDVILISLDLDALSFAYAPGVSAPQGEGFTASEVYQMLEVAGSDKKVASLGIYELNPALDVQDLTSRLAAQAAWHFLNAKLYHS
ncbi:MAG: formimidoylglutamase [Bdellovibrionales bacterium]|nr:formimidoylglutamase [Oligoflexia bacterium]